MPATPDDELTAAVRFVVTLADGSSVFVKAAVDDETERLSDVAGATRRFRP